MRKVLNVLSKFTDSTRPVNSARVQSLHLEPSSPCPDMTHTLFIVCVTSGLEGGRVWNSRILIFHHVATDDWVRGTPSPMSRCRGCGTS
jgi:hypothetical protein